MLHTDTCKSQATNRRSCHASHRYQQIPDNKSHFLPCFTQIPANHRQQIILLVMPHTDTSKSQAILPTNRTSYHASHRYQQITGNKSYILPCLTQIPENHRKQNVYLAMPHTYSRKSQATQCTSYHASHRYQQITGNKSGASKSQTTNRTSYMRRTDASQSQATNRTSYHASYRYQQITGKKTYILPCLTRTPENHRQQIVHLAMLHTDTSKSQAILPTNRTSCHASHRYQKITGHLANKSYILPCLTQTPANHRQQIVHLTKPHTDTSKSQATNRTSYHASHRYQQITGDKSFILPCLTQIISNHRQQIVHLTMLHTNTRKSQATNHTSCHAMPHADTSKSQATNRISILPCLTQIPANHRKQIAHLAMPHTDTIKSQATNRTSYHASHRHQQITGNKSCILPCLTQIPANPRQQIALLTMLHTGTSQS